MGKGFVEELKKAGEEGNLGVFDLETRARLDFVSHTATPDTLNIKGLRIGDDKEPPPFIVTGIVGEQDGTDSGLRTESRIFIPTRPDVPKGGPIETYSVSIPSRALDRLPPDQPIFLHELFESRNKTAGEDDPSAGDTRFLPSPRKPY